MWIGVGVLCAAAAIVVALVADAWRRPIVAEIRCWQCGQIVPLAATIVGRCPACAPLPLPVSTPAPARTCADCGAGLPQRHQWSRCERCLGAYVAQILAQRRAGGYDEAMVRRLIQQALDD